MKQQKPEKSFFANNMSSLHIAVRAIGKLTPSKEKCYRIKVTLDTESRSDKQNKLYYWWLKPRADHLGNNLIEERRSCKLMFGVTILLVEDEEFHKFYMKSLKHLTHEEMLEAMDFVPVTSRMNTKQMAQYLHDMEIDTAQQGLALEKPRDLYMDALMIQEGKSQ